MANETTIDFLNNIDKAEPFKEEPVVEPEEEKEEVAGEEKPLPFNKDPKVQRYIEKQVEKAMKDIRPSTEQTFRKEVDEEINLPASFIKLVGNDTDEKKEVLKDLSKYFGTLKGEARKEFLEEMNQKEIQAKEADNAALEELNSGFEAIEEQYGVDLDADSKTRAAFVEYLQKVSPKNADGEVTQFADIPSAWEVFQERAKPEPKASRAKELASRGMTRSTDTSAPAIRSGNGWKDVEKHFQSLTNN